MSELALGVDVGSGAARAVALTPRGDVRAVASADYAGAEGWPPGRANPGAWLRACIDCCEEIAAQVPGDRLASVAVGGQSPTTVPADGGLAVTIRHPAGNDGDNARRQQAQRAVIDAERPTPAEPRQLWDWVLERLGAEPGQGRWPGDPDLEGFGPLRGTGEVVGRARGTPGIPEGTPLVTGAQDAYLAFWAGGLDTPGRAMDPGGRTGGLAVAVPVDFSAAGLWTFPSAARGVAIAGGPVNAHGTSVEWAARLLGTTVDGVLALAARAPAGAGGALFLPYLEGERAPRWDSRLRGAVVGLTAQTGPEHLARAVVEGTALGLAHVASGLRQAGARLDVLVCAGAPARSELWCCLKAAALGTDAEIPEDPDLAAFGAALAAGAGAGWWPRPGEGDPGAWPRPRMRRLSPSASDAIDDSLLRRFVAAGDVLQAHTDIFGQITSRD